MPRRRGQAPESSELKAIAGPKAPSGGAKPMPVGEHQPGEGGGPDGVREEGEPAQDDPGAEDPGANRQDQDLDQAPLDEGELEGFQHSAEASKGLRLSLVI